MLAIGRRIDNLAEPRKDKLCSQPTSARRSTHRPRLLHRRSCVPWHSKPVDSRGPRAEAPRLADPRVQGLLHVLLNQEQGSPRGHSSAAGEEAQPSPSGRAAYDLRRLRLHGLIEHTQAHRYRISAKGLRTPRSSTCVSHPFQPMPTCPSQDPLARRKPPSTQNSRSENLTHVRHKPFDQV